MVSWLARQMLMKTSHTHAHTYTQSVTLATPTDWRLFIGQLVSTADAHEKKTRAYSMVIYLLQGARQSFLVGVGLLLGEAGPFLHRTSLPLPELCCGHQVPTLRLQVPNLFVGHLYAGLAKAGRGGSRGKEKGRRGAVVGEGGGGGKIVRHFAVATWMEGKV